jgi:chaperonin GroEL
MEQSMSKLVCYGEELRRATLNGASKLNKCVSSTMGPRGRTVILQKKGQSPIVTKDGVSCAEFFELEDPFENASATIIKQAARQSANSAGDGTTTATVLAHSILVQAQPYLAAGISPIDLKRGIDKAIEFIVGELPRWSKPVSGEEDLERIATISANGDKSIGKLIAKAVDLVGKDGSILIQEAKSMHTSLDIVEGFRFDSGFASSQFVTNERKGIMSYNEPYFLITDERIEAVEQLLPVLEIAARESKPLIVIAEEIEGQALAALIMNSLRGTMAVAAIKAPRYGEERRNILSDLAVSLGATYFTRMSGADIRIAKLKDLGKAKSIECSKVQTIIMGGKGDPTKIQEKIEALKEEIASTNDVDTCKPIMERITRLASGIAVINVGAATEIEMIEKKHRIEDALEAVKSALEEGIIPGSGITLAKVATDNRLHIKVDFEAEKYGVDIVVKACQQPLRTIVENGGGKPDVILAQALDSEYDMCYDAVNECFVDAYEKGIIDPVKVARCALQNAGSAAGTLITTDHAVIEL